MDKKTPAESGSPAYTNRPGKGHAYWIHEKVRSKSSVTGYYSLPECRCSNCKTRSRREVLRCPGCGAIMDGKPEK